MIDQPTPLKKGDKVAFTCPAKELPHEPIDAIKLLESWGLCVILGDTVKTSHHQFAGNDTLRAQDFQRFLDDDSIKAIFAARGGYGTIRIIDQLNFSKFIKNPKWVVGFSDITVLHSHIHTNYQIETIHGQMPLTISNGSTASLETLRKALFNEPLQYQYPNKTISQYGISQGLLIGGNLAILVSLLGSSSEIDYRDKILFLEDVGEYLYAIDRMLWTLKRAGKLAHLKGLIVGGFTELKDFDPPFGQTVEEMVLEKVKEYGYPVCFGFPAGHISNNQALIFGRQALLQVNEQEIRLS
ncbi:MAG: LD-carboxypeptidase [Sphingobacteriaceae bacterium]|jgi:muramoyltetrapeptide carboxypeptidase|nr:MAG: LD-carboxypeptidase [Pedobacter sp.]